ncbi:uncharacterized protein LOC113465497 isoform X2 [Diaphorina citri]|nr:uncharacterized protein LOC113465497 isoform X2 [Diaphorina citri]
MSEFRVPEVVVSPSSMALSEPILDYPAHHSTGGASINERRGSRTGGSMFLAPYCQLAPRRRHSWIGGYVHIMFRSLAMSPYIGIFTDYRKNLVCM